jgi:hypothetical protein
MQFREHRSYERDVHITLTETSQKNEADLKQDDYNSHCRMSGAEDALPSMQ